MVSRSKWLVGLVLITFLNVNIGLSAEEKIIFKKQTIWVDSKKILVEIADTEAKHARGLMNRTKLKVNEGMLFVFADDDYRSFWMKNTLINLSIGYFNKNKKLIDIQEMTAVTSVMQSEIPTYPSKGLASYALEMSEGWFKKNKISEGALLKYTEAKRP